MRTGSIDFERFSQAAVRLGETVLDPTIWPEVMQQICASMNVRGAALLQGDVRTPDVPRTPAVSEAFDSYFNEGWHERDIRARGIPLLLRGQRVITDQDVVTPDEMKRDVFYNECVYANGLKWFAAIGFFAGRSCWALSMQRTTKQGPFEAEELTALAALSPRLTEVATLSTLIGQRVISDTTDALVRMNQPAIVIDRRGLVLGTNGAAESLLDDQLRITNRRIYSCDKTANSRLEALIRRIAITPELADLPVEPFIIRRAQKKPILVRICPVSATARTPFLGGRVVLLLSELGAIRPPAPDLLTQAFGLTPAEARLAAQIATGAGTEEAARMLGIARETARNQLKAVLAKTGTHRQGELVAMISRL
jgi:DNA-binding CsgD family transcriptional regulator